MNTSPRRNIEGARTVITYMAMKALESQLEKGQKNGDATKVVTSGELESINDLTPRIETSAETHIVSDEGYRISSKGEKTNIKIDKRRRQLQLAIMREQENSLEDNSRE